MTTQVDSRKHPAECPARAPPIVAIFHTPGGYLVQHLPVITKLMGDFFQKIARGVEIDGNWIYLSVVTVDVYQWRRVNLIFFVAFWRREDGCNVLGVTCLCELVRSGLRDRAIYQSTERERERERNSWPGG